MQCGQHSKPFTHICRSPECFNFRLLCSTCEQEDVYYHRHVSLEDGQNQCERVLNSFKNKINTLKGQVADFIDNGRFERGFSDLQKQLDRVHATLTELFGSFKERLRKRFEKEQSQKLQRLYEEIEESYQYALRLQKADESQRMRKILRNDIEYDRRYIEQYFEQLKAGKSSEWKLDDDKVLKLIVNFENNIKDLFLDAECVVDLDYHYYSTGLLHMVRGERDKMVALYQRNPQTKQLEKNYLDKVRPQFRGVVQSVYLQDTIYLVGQGELDSNRIFQLNPQTQELSVCDNMITRRRNMSVCVLQNEIYIVGGENDEEGCLLKCQKFSLRTSRDITNVSRINSLNCRSSHHSTHAFKNRFIFKFGGVSNHLTNKLMCSSLIEVYHREIDQWKIVEVVGSEAFDRQFTYLSGVVQNFDGQFIIFGGYNSKRQPVTTSYMVEVDYRNGVIGDIKVNRQMRYSHTGTYYGHAETIEGIRLLLKLTSRGEVQMEQHRGQRIVRPA